MTCISHDQPMRYQDNNLDLLVKYQMEIERIARRIGGTGGQSARDFVDEAPSILWEKMQNVGDINEVTFLGWCKTVLRNAFVDRVRRESQQRRLLDEMQTESRSQIQSVQTWQSQLHQQDVTLAQKEFVSARDLKRLEKWSARQVVIVLCVIGLWRCVPGLFLLNCIEQVIEPRKFPFDKLTSEPDIGCNVKLLATTFNRRPDSILKMVRRSFAELRELDAIQNLQT